MNWKECKMSKDMILTGRLWVLKQNNDLFEDIDTDMIYHNAHLAVTDIAEMGKFTFGNLEGYMDFAEHAKPGDIVLVGENFGSGSSRQHAVDCFKALGVQAVIARSFGAIYKRNAINSGFPIIEIPDIKADAFENYEVVRLNVEDGVLSSEDVSIIGNPMSKVARDIYLAGGLFEYAD